MAEMSECSKHDEGAIYYEQKKCPVCAAEQDARDAVTLLLGAEAERDLVVARWEARWSELRADIDDLDMESCDDDHQLGWCEAVAQVRDHINREPTADCVKVVVTGSMFKRMLGVKRPSGNYESVAEYALPIAGVKSGDTVYLVRLKGVE